MTVAPLEPMSEDWRLLGGGGNNDNEWVLSTQLIVVFARCVKKLLYSAPGRNDDGCDINVSLSYIALLSYARYKSENVGCDTRVYFSLSLDTKVWKVLRSSENDAFRSDLI